MSTYELIKAVLGKTNRSDIHHFVIPGLYVDRSAQAARDIPDDHSPGTAEREETNPRP